MMKNIVLIWGCLIINLFDNISQPEQTKVMQAEHKKIRTL